MNFDEFKIGIELVIESLTEDLKKMRGTRVTPELLADVKIEAYEVISPLKNYANISVSDSKTLLVQLWDKTIIHNVEKGLLAADLGASIQVGGESIRVIMPDMTLERREEMVKIMKQRIEQARIAVRNVRHEIMKELDDLVKNGGSEEDAFRQKEEIEKVVKSANEQIEGVKDRKESDLLTV